MHAKLFRVPWRRRNGACLHARPQGNMCAALRPSLASVSLPPGAVLQHGLIVCARAFAVCQECIESNHFYVRARRAAAHCAPCSSVSTSGASILLTVSIIMGLIATSVSIWLRRSSGRWKHFAVRVWSAAIIDYSFHNKLKIIIGARTSHGPHCCTPALACTVLPTIDSGSGDELRCKRVHASTLRVLSDRHSNRGRLRPLPPCGRA